MKFNFEIHHRRLTDLVNVENDPLARVCHVVDLHIRLVIRHPIRNVRSAEIAGEGQRDPPAAGISGSCVADEEEALL